MKRIRMSGALAIVAAVLMGVLPAASSQSAAAQTVAAPSPTQASTSSDSSEPERGLSDEPGYGGAWIDAEGNTQVNFTQARAAAARKASAEAAGSAFGPSTVRVVKYDLKQLNGLVTDARSALEQAGLSKVAKARVDIPGNGVEVIALPADAQKAKLAISAVPATKVVKDSKADAVADPVVCTNRLNCGAPLRAGIEIHNGGIGCSAGFTATASDTSRWLLTAGHCGAKDTNWTHGEQPIGPIRQVAKSLFWLDPYVRGYVLIDVARIRIDSSYWRQAAGGFMYDTASSTYPVKLAVATEAVPVGARVCRTSYSPNHSESASKCGTVVTPFGREGAIEVSGMTVCHGDSGGAVYWENTTGKHAFALVSLIFKEEDTSPACVQSGQNSGLTGISGIYHWFDENAGGATIRVDRQ